MIPYHLPPVARPRTLADGIIILLGLSSFNSPSQLLRSTVAVPITKL